MKKLKKLSLENEMKKEAEQIEKKVREKSRPQKEEKQACNRSTGSSADFGVRKCDDKCGE